MLNKLMFIIIIFICSCSSTIKRTSGIVETWNGNRYFFQQAELHINDTQIVIDKQNGESVTIKQRQIKLIRVVKDYE